MKVLHYIFSIILIGFASLLMGQSYTSSVAHLEYRNNQKSKTQVINELCIQLNIEGNNLHSEYKRESDYGFTHEKFSQTYNDIPIYGSSYIIHTQSNNAISSNGYLAANVNINTEPKLQQATAERIAKSEMPSAEYFDDRIEPTQLVIIDEVFPQISENYKLAYKVEVYSADPLEKKIFFIDAMNGNIILDLPGLAHDATPATAQTKYYGAQQIITEKMPDGSYILQDLTRGDGITTLNYDFTNFHNNTTNWDLTNVNQDEVALDAHYATEQFYDMMLQRHNWDGLDGNGKSMNPIIHIGEGANIVNAFWDGNNAWFGDGDCHRGPLTTLEVVAHEFMHGITDYTSDLIYAFESGAINESMSDIFGKALEYYIDPDHFRWTIGESFMQTDFIEPFRYMDDPNRKNMPAYYKGKYWTDGGGVHQHSAIGNLWFHLLVEGRSDTTELGESYNVTGIGMDKAIGIVWEIQSNYLTPTATYNDMYLSSIDATSAIYGEESPELNDVIQAWKAVGLPHNAPGPNALSHDIAVQIDFVAQRQCLRNSYLPFTVKLVNYGSENIPDSSALQLIIEDANNEDTWIEIFDAIPSGQTLSITIDSMFYISDPGRYFITAFADYELDENLRNNNYNLRPYRIDNFDPTFNSLDYNIIDIDTPCFTDSITFDVFIRNLSCNTIAANSAINYIIYDNLLEPIKENTIILTEDLISGERFTIPEYIIGNYETLSIEAYTVINQNPDRILEEIEIEYKREISDEYYNDLSDVERNATDFDVFKMDNLVDYQGNMYIAKSGGTQEELFYPCPDSSDDFQSISGYHNGFASISACIDMSEIQNPILNFDLVQLRDNSDIIPELESLRTRAKISWGTSADEYIIVSELEEGVEEKISIPLPSNYTGEVSLKFVQLTGTWYNENNPSAYFDYDVNMIRNLELKNVNSATDKILDSQITVSPNPSNGIYHIESPYNIDQIRITDLQGRLLVSENNTSNVIYIPTIKSGYYIMEIQLNDGRQISKPLINIKE